MKVIVIVIMIIIVIDNSDSDNSNSDNKAYFRACCKQDGNGTPRSISTNFKPSDSMKEASITPAALLDSNKWI